MRKNLLVTAFLAASIPLGAAPLLKAPSVSYGMTCEMQGEPITDPQGTVKLLALYGHQYNPHPVMPEMPLGSEITGYATKMVEGEGKDVYIYNPFAEFPTDSYLMGTRESDTEIKIELPQAIYAGEVNGAQVTYYADRLSFVVEDEMTGSGWFYHDDTDSTIVFTYDADEEMWVWNQDGEKDILLGLCNEDGEWLLTGNMQMSYAYFESELVTPPSGLEAMDWIVRYGESGERPVRIAFSDDASAVYVQGVSETFPEAWIEGYQDYDDYDKYIFYSGQYLGINPENNCYGFMQAAYLDEYYDPEEESQVYVITKKSRLAFNYDKELKLMTTSDYIIIGNGDNRLSIIENLRQPSFLEPRELPDLPVFPSDLSYEMWVFSSGDSYRNINVALKDNIMYIKGLSESMPESTVVGNISDGTVTFDSQQFVGSSSLYPVGIWFMAAANERVYDEYWDEYTTKIVFRDNVAFKYDEVSSRLSVSDNGLITFSQSPDNTGSIVEKYNNPIIRKLPATTSMVPANPEVIWFYKYDDYFGSGNFFTKLPKTNIDGIELDVDNLFYRFYIDDEIFMLDENLYPGVEDPSMIPYEFSNNKNIFVSGTTHELHFVEEDITNIGVQLVNKVDDCLYVSDIIYSDGSILSEITESDMNKTVVSDRTYDLNGVLISDSFKGIAIRIITFSDGTVRTSKILR